MVKTNGSTVPDILARIRRGVSPTEMESAAVMVRMRNGRQDPAIAELATLFPAEWSRVCDESRAS